MVRASVSSNSGFEAAHADVTFTISVESQTVTWSPTNVNLQLPVTTATPSSQALSSGPGTISYSVNSAGTTGCTVNAASGQITFSSDGTCVIRATASASLTHSAATADVAFVIAPDPNAISINSVATATTSTIKIYGLTPRSVVLGQTPSVVLSTSISSGSVSVSIAGRQIGASLNSFGQVTFSLPSLPIGTHAIELLFSQAGSLKFEQAITIIEKENRRRSGVEVTARFAFAPSVIVGNDLRSDAKEMLNGVAKIAGPLVSMRCTAVVPAIENSASARKAALNRAKLVCQSASQAVGIKSFSASIRVSAQKAASLRQVLLEIVFNR